MQQQREATCRINILGFRALDFGLHDGGQEEQQHNRSAHCRKEENLSNQ